MGALLMVITSILFPPILLSGFFIVRPREEIVVLRFGKHVGTVKRSGVNWVHPMGRELRRIPTTITTMDMKTTTVLERNGNPILISAVVMWQVQDSYKAAIDVTDHLKFVHDQTGAVVKRVASRYPYESREPDEPCLKVENDEITQALITELTDAVSRAGVQIMSVRLNDLTYAPEIAQAMLMRQQAQALVDARKTIVDGGVQIVRDAIARLRAEHIDLSDAQREQLVTNLLVVICSGQNAQPVVQVQSQPT